MGGKRKPIRGPRANLPLRLLPGLQDGGWGHLHTAGGHPSLTCMHSFPTSLASRRPHAWPVLTCTCQRRESESKSDDPQGKPFLVCVFFSK